jgi:2-phosphosulfolactate phosphatase
MDVYSTAWSFQEEETRGKTVVVIDVLRASSTIVTALANGAKGIIPVEDMGKAGTIAQQLDAKTYLLCGERDGKKIEGYALGNSPLEYTRETVEGKTLILTTTNGTVAISRSLGAEHVLIGSFLNATAVADAVKASGSDVMFVCAGWKSRLSMEDLLCAGLIIDLIHGGAPSDEAPDGATIAHGLYTKFASSLKKTIHSTNHAMRLKELGSEADIPYCSEIDLFNHVPRLQDGILR